MADAPPPPNPPIPPPSPGGSPNPKTSSVPLKKETVRITLRAKPGEPPPPDVPSATPPTTPLRPPAPPPPGGRPAPPPAPIGSKTIPLTQPPAPRTPGAPHPARPATTPMGGAPATQPMPKPTVRLQAPPPASGPGTTAVTSAPVRTAVIDEEEEGADEGNLNILAIITLALAAIIMLVVLFSSDEFGPAVDRTGASTSFLKFPQAEPGNASAVAGPGGEITFRSNLELKEIPQFNPGPQ